MQFWKSQSLLIGPVAFGALMAGSMCQSKTAYLKGGHCREGVGEGSSRGEGVDKGGNEWVHAKKNFKAIKLGRKASCRTKLNDVSFKSQAPVCRMSLQTCWQMPRPAPHRVCTRRRDKRQVGRLMLLGPIMQPRIARHHDKKTSLARNNEEVFQSARQFARNSATVNRFFCSTLCWLSK
ncbi:hypothetical protein U0070_015149 [Myodes glareolus]|uniref:Secreted protein n=1 Tax=Myodes glareolus TaxID=447135 RepID=A0AAW0HBR0_MYOGA